MACIEKEVEQVAEDWVKKRRKELNTDDWV